RRNPFRPDNTRISSSDLFSFALVHRSPQPQSTFVISVSASQLNFVILFSTIRRVLKFGALLLVVIQCGCGRVSSLNRDQMKDEAVQFTQRQLAEKWFERSGSWYSSEPSILITHGTMYIEARKVEPHVTPHELSEADKLNGVQWSGDVVCIGA